VAVEDIAAKIASRIVGRSLIRAERNDYDWEFCFAQDACLRVECSWRILIDGRIAFAGDDHDQKFGLPQPLNGPRECDRLLREKTIDAVRIRADAGDLTIEFSGGAALEVLNTSCGYENWQFRDAGLQVIALGGGELAFLEP
jgi:hypothetical protein